MRSTGQTSPADPQDIGHAHAALVGTSVGDAFGQCFFGDELRARAQVAARTVPRGPWIWSDDTALALCVFRVLRTVGRIDQDRLAWCFGQTFREEPARAYGPAMYALLEKYIVGSEWRSLAGRQFRGAGSFGNGAAMRAAPVGAYFARDLDRVVAEAAASAEVTHTHPEGIAGAVAVAVAAALAAGVPGLQGAEFITAVCAHLPGSKVRDQTERAVPFDATARVEDMVAILGNGSHISAQDTVPIALWCAAHHLSDFEGALWTMVSALGDRDTTCAIVGGIVAARVGEHGIPDEWAARREPLPPWASAVSDTGGYLS